jgi:hypothetical protein
MVDQRRLHVRWWHVAMLAVLLLLLLVAVTGLTLRSIGRSEYAAVVDGLRLQGKPADIDDFIAGAPPVDVVLQQDWDRLASSLPLFPEARIPSHAWDLYLTGQGPVPPAIAQELESRRAAFQPALELLRRDRLVLSVLGWVAQDCPPGQRTLPRVSRVRIPSLLSCRSLCEWLRYETITATDPTASLADLERLLRAMDRPGCLIDAMIAIACAAMRDRAHLELALLDRLPAVAKERWVAESGPAMGWVANGFDGERALFIDSCVGWFDAEPWSSMWEYGSFTGFAIPTPPWWDVRWLYAGPYAFSTMHHDCAVSAGFEAAVSARLRRERTAPLPAMTAIMERYWGHGAMGIPNLMECSITALERDAAHRVARLGVHLIDRARTGAIPADQAALARLPEGARLLAPTGDHLSLRYEHLGGLRFRVVIDPAGIPPDFDDPTRMPLRSKRFGQPPAAGRLHVESGPRSLEVDLAPGPGSATTP